MTESSGHVGVSVVINFLDEARFLHEAIDSVFAQTYHEWELLLVDDGSTDESVQIARSLAEQHPERVRYLEHPNHANMGTSAARNLGIQRARGEYIAFLDGDDVWLPRKLDRQLALMRAHPDVGMVYGTTQLWHSWSGDPLDAGRDLTPDLGVPLDQPLVGPAFLARMLRHQALAPCICSILLRREVVAAAGGFEPAFRGMHDDQAFIAKVCLAASILASGECWDRYRQHSESCYAIARATGVDKPARRFFLNWLESYLRDRRVADRVLWRALRLELAASESQDASPRVGQLRRLVRSLGRRRREQTPGEGRVNFGSLRRLAPISRRWGKDRGGQPIDRYYIENFLAAHAADVRGRVLEVGDNIYTRRFGAGAVDRSDVLHAQPGNPKATIVADLARCGAGLPAATFDCVILTQVLQMIGDPGAALQSIRRTLQPGGVVLASVPGISQVSRWDMHRWGDYWRFTTLSARRLFEAAFPPELVGVEAHGNVLAAVAFLHGLSASELRREELDAHDPDYPLLVTIRAESPV
jgi:glycosyltransferase involved in cell wall biosynthesis